LRSLPSRPFLASVELIAAGQHGNPGGYQRPKNAVAGGLPLLAEIGVLIPGDAIWQIERIEIALGGAVVGDEEVHRVPWFAAIVLVPILGAREALGLVSGSDPFMGKLVLGFAKGVSEAVVPLGPAGGKVPLLLSPFIGAVPGFGTTAAYWD